MKLTVNKNNLILFLVLAMMILPTINFLGFEMPVIYLLTPIGIFIMIFILMGKIKIPRIVKTLIIIWLLIIIQIIITTLYSTVRKLGYFVFPTDVIQYVVRFIFFISFITLAYKGKIDKDKFIKYFIFILILGMSIGILQWFPWFGRQFLTELYPFRDGTLQIRHLNRSLHLLRVHGFAQHATANGGIASFAFVYGYSVRKYYKKYNVLSLMLIIMSILNIFASQARAGMLAIVFSVLLLYLVNIKYERKGVKPTFYIILIAVFSSLIFYYLYNSGNPFISVTYDRWVNLFETSGGGRATRQPQYFFSIMDNSDYLFGLSKPIINISEISHGIETEPLNIFVTYGFLGFLLQYTLIIFLLRYFFRKINKNIKDKAILTLIIASFVGLFGYQIFSVAFFFFREIRIGLFPWLLMGVTIGIYEKQKNMNKIL